MALLKQKPERIIRRARFAAWLVMSLALVPWAAGGAARQSSAGDGAGFLNIALPQSGEVLVENRRGGVEIEVYSEDHVAVAAVVERRVRARRRQSPINVEHTGGLLTIKVRGAAAVPPPSRVDLKLRVPAQTRLKVFTSGGYLNVSGVPASLDAQTISGDLRLALPVPPDASVTAHSLNGEVALGDGVEAPDGGERVRRGKFQARWGAGGHVVNLFSGRGRISLAALSRERPGSDAAAEVPRQPRVKVVAEGEARHTPAPTPEVAEAPQEVGEDEVVRVESDLVTLNVSVVDRASGRGIVGLTANDFRIYEDGAEQRIEHFESAEAPFDLLLLLDLSGSTARVTDTIRAAARRFVAATRPRDRIAIITFAGETEIVSPLTSDRAALRDAINRIATPKGDTRLYDALASGLDYMGRGADAARRRAVILMSDGLDSTLPNVTGTGSTLSYEEVRRRAQEFDGVLYTVWTSTEYEALSPLDIQPETFDRASDRMEELADAGGGVFYEVERLEDLAGAYERVVADLSTVYSLSYRPTNKQRDGRWRAIRVRLPRHGDAVARGRRGYFAK